MTNAGGRPPWGGHTRAQIAEANMTVHGLAATTCRRQDTQAAHTTKPIARWHTACRPTGLELPPSGEADIP